MEARKTDSNKLEPRWHGPCIIEAVVAHQQYKIRIDHNRVKNSGVEHLKAYIPPLHGDPLPLYYTRIPKVSLDKDVHEEKDPIVQQILEHQRREGVLQWKVRWKDEPASEDTWEPASSFIGSMNQKWMNYNRRNNVHVPLESVNLLSYQRDSQATF